MLLVLAALLAMGLVTGLAVLATIFWWLRRQNRVHLRHRTEAPLTWLASPAPAARAHRQLRGAVRLTAVDTLPPALREPAFELQAEAVRLDAELVRAARLPSGERKPRVRALRARSCVVERTAVQLVDLARRPVSPTPPDPLDDLVERLDLVARARADLEKETATPSWTSAGQLAGRQAR